MLNLFRRTTHYMELVKNIFFNTDKLIPFANIKISYTGKFFSDSSENVYIHYGFGNNWDGKTDLKMTKTELGFQAEIKLTNSDTFNFCFYNEKNDWDNNNNNNYIFKIEPISSTNQELTNELSLLPTTNINKFYLWKKKFKISIYKAITYLPNLLLGKYKRKLDADNMNNN